MDYSEEDIKLSSGEPRTKIEPLSSYLLGPTSEFDDVYVFDHKLDALHFVKSFFDAQIEDPETENLDKQILHIQNTRSDEETLDLKDLFKDSESIEIYAEGYWEAFVLSSQSFWPEWSELYKEDELLSTDWDTEDQDPDGYEIDDDISEDPDQSRSGLLFSEPPDDVFNPEFVDEMLSIIPVA